MIKCDFRSIKHLSATAINPFDAGLAELRSEGYEVISAFQNARLRIVSGIESDISQAGNFVMHGYAFSKNGSPLFIRESPFCTNPLLLSQAIAASKEGKYLITDNDIYEENLALARQDLGRDPFDRRVLILPSSRVVRLSFKHNTETLNGILGDLSRYYLEFLKTDTLLMSLAHRFPEEYDGTLLRQVWFQNALGARDTGRYICSDATYFSHAEAVVRGIKEVN